MTDWGLILHPKIAISTLTTKLSWPKCIETALYCRFCFRTSTQKAQKTATIEVNLPDISTKKAWFPHHNAKFRRIFWLYRPYPLPLPSYNMVFYRKTSTNLLTHMKKIFLYAAFLGAVVSMGSCVSKKEFQQLKGDYTNLQGLYNQSQVDLATARTHGKSLEDRLADAQRENSELKRQLSALQGSLDKSLLQNNQGSINISKLVDEINASNKYIKQLVEAKTKSDSLNLVLTNNLTRSLSRDELQEVDVKVLKGVVYVSLADNMLYRSGSYEVNERAKTTLSKIAKILGDYKDFEVLVEGNTDDVPITRPNIRNNWDLSALRASSVVQVLQNDYGITPNRLSAAGRGQYNPVATNDTELGRQRNRRTQIIITPKLDQFLDLIDKAPATEK